MTTPSTLDDLGAAPLVRTEHHDTAELQAQLLASWSSSATERATTFDRTAGRKAAFHAKRVAELSSLSDDAARKIAAANHAEEHWRAQVGCGAELVGRLVTGLRLLTETPISQVASWAIWDEHAPGDGHWYEHRESLDRLTSGCDRPNTSAVFLELNAGAQVATDERSDAWSMFHGSPGDGLDSRKHGNIRNIADHLVNTPLWGSYMTAFYKNVPAVDEQVLKALLDAASTPDIRALNTLMALIIRDELTRFGFNVSETYAVALGGRTANLTRKTMRDWRGVVELPHYAASIKAETFRAATDEALTLTHPEFRRDA